MQKTLLILCLLTLNIYASKNWIKLDSHNTSDTTTSIKSIKEDETTLKMLAPRPSIKAIKNLEQAKKTKPSHNSEKELLEIFKQLNNVAHKVQSKIKKQKPTINN